MTVDVIDEGDHVFEVTADRVNLSGFTAAALDITHGTGMQTSQS